MKHIRTRIWLAITALLLTLAGTLARASDTAPIVIVSSYNPDVKSISDNIAAFSEEYTRLGMKNPIALEDMHCQNLPECTKWKDRLWKILKPYYANGQKPAAIVLLGNEAGSTFFSINQPELKSTPVVVGQRGKTLVKLPESDTVDIATWEPECYDLTKNFRDYKIVGGRVYHYDVDKTIELVEQFYPERDTLVFLSDNTWGGLTMRATFLHAMKQKPMYKVKTLDGRTMTFFEVNDIVASLSDHHAFIIGTWRIDKTNRFRVQNTTHALSACNPELPTFTLSSLGMGHWALAGYTPKFHIMGKYLAEDVWHYLETKEVKKLTVVPSQYMIDVEKAKELNVTLDTIRYEYVPINKKVSFFEEYKHTILFVSGLILVLSTALSVSLHYLRRSKIAEKTLRKQSEELEKAKERAEEANQMKSAFIANMSHEIRTPLNAVTGFAQMLSSPDFEFSPEEKAEFGAVIMTNSELLLKLMGDILDISKIDAGKIQYDIRPINIVQLCRMAVESANVQPKEGVEIRTESAKDSVTIDTDKERVLQVLTNLLSNAKKCTDKGSVTVSVKEMPEEGMISISVTDTGCGIPKEKAEEVFERFKKLDNFRQGTGLGLSIARAIVKQLGGEIWVDTTYTDGARFTFTHPLHAKKPE